MASFFRISVEEVEHVTHRTKIYYLALTRGCLQIQIQILWCNGLAKTHHLRNPGQAAGVW